MFSMRTAYAQHHSPDRHCRDEWLQLACVALDSRDCTHAHKVSATSQGAQCVPESNACLAGVQRHASGLCALDADYRQHSDITTASKDTTLTCTEYDKACVGSQRDATPPRNANIDVRVLSVRTKERSHSATSPANPNASASFKEVVLVVVVEDAAADVAALAAVACRSTIDAASYAITPSRANAARCALAGTAVR
jgi:hypothetical protein